MSQKELIISHRTYLTKDQRYSLFKESLKLEVNGNCLSVWRKGIKTNEPCEEVSQKYFITNDYSKPVLQKIDDIYTVNLPCRDSLIGLLDPKEGGHKSFRFTYKEISSENSKTNITTHYIIISDYDEMLKSVIE